MPCTRHAHAIHLRDAHVHACTGCMFGTQRVWHLSDDSRDWSGSAVLYMPCTCHTREGCTCRAHAIHMPCTRAYMPRLRGPAPVEEHMPYTADAHVHTCMGYMLERAMHITGAGRRACHTHEDAHVYTCMGYMFITGAGRRAPPRARPSPPRAAATPRPRPRRSTG